MCANNRVSSEEISRVQQVNVNLATEKMVVVTLLKVKLLQVKLLVP